MVTGLMVDFFWVIEVFRAASVSIKVGEAFSVVKELVVGLVTQDVSRNPESNVMVFLFILWFPPVII